MKTLIIGVLAALLMAIMSLQGADAATRGKRFHDGFANPGQLADAVQANLDKDPSGDRMLNPELCKAPHWSCGAPIDYLKIINKFNPRATVNGEPLMRVDQLPAFFRKLVIRAAPPGKYWMACMVKDPKGISTASGYMPIANCLARAFHKGEPAWFDPDTNVPVLARDCTNPVGQPEKPEGCVYIEYDTFTANLDAVVHVKQYGETDASLDDVCPPAILRAGETDWESLFVEACYDPTVCFTNGADRVVGSQTNHWKTGSHPASPGHNWIRLNAEFAEKDSSYRMFFCLKRSDNSRSCAVGVRWFNYVYDKKMRAKVATIYYTEAEADEAQKKTKMEFVPYWSFNHVKDCPEFPSPVQSQPTETEEGQ